MVSINPMSSVMFHMGCVLDGASVITGIIGTIYSDKKGNTITVNFL